MQLFEMGADGNGSFTSTNTTLTTSVQTATLAYPSRHIMLNCIGSSTVYFTLDGSTPTSSSFNLSGGQLLPLVGLPAITSVKFLGSAASGSLSILAW
jgi:hypothetical protein